MSAKKTPGSRALKAVILVGGMGTRLRPLTDNCPKPIVPVLNRPFLEHTLAYLKQFGIEDVVLAMSFLPEAIQEYFGDGGRCGMRLTYCVEKDPLGTAGAVKNAEAYLDTPFVVLNGDNVFTDMDLNEMFAFHCENKSKATIALTWVENPSSFGVVETDENQKVRRFIEKPPLAEATTHWINAGGYILEPEVLEHVPPGQHYMFEKGLFPHLLDIGEPVFGYPYNGYWLDMGTPQKYFTFNMDLLNSKAKSPLLCYNGKNNIYNSLADIPPTTVIEGQVLFGGECKTGKGVNIKGPVVLGRGCVLNDGACLEQAILWDNVVIGKNARLYQCIIGNDVVIPDNQEIKNCVVTQSRTVPLSV
jgi:mannose-1-phosphate guanylyltransferase